MTVVNVGIIVAGLCLFIAYRVLTDPLKRYPGPFLARWTELWRLWDCWSGLHRLPSLIQLHRKYGEVVRIGPSTLSFSHPQAIKDIYGTDKPYPKAEFYAVAAASARGVVTPSLFSSLDIAWHDNLKRAVNPAFSLSALVQYEPYVDNTIREFLHQLESRYADVPGPAGLVALHRWSHYYSYDVIGELTYGAPFGFLRTGSDVDDIISVTRKFLNYTLIVGMMPILDRLLVKNPVLLWLNRRGYFNARPNPAVLWALKHQAATLSAAADGAVVDDRKPLLVKFTEAKEKHPDAVSDKEVLGMGLSMVFAGSETTAITVTALLYFLLKSKHAYRALQSELDASFPPPSPSLPTAYEPIPFRTSFHLPYLDACIKEALRLHPAARFSLDRLLTSDAVIRSHPVPAGTTVGVNAWPLHRNPDVFGADVDAFRPERWLAEAESDEHLDRMNRSLFAFGAGRFQCIGRNISLLEMYKVVPALLRRFTLSFDDPAYEWKWEEGSFVNVCVERVRFAKR